MPSDICKITFYKISKSTFLAWIFISKFHFFATRKQMFEITTRFAIVLTPHSFSKVDGLPYKIKPEIDMREICRFFCR